MPRSMLLLLAISSAYGKADPARDDSLTLLHLAVAVVESDTSGACHGLPEHTPSFEAFVKKYNRSYSGEAEYQNRLALYQARVGTIHKQNCRRDSWTATVNHFSDRSHEELNQLHGWKGAAKGHVRSGAPLSLLQLDRQRNWHFDYQSFKSRFEGHHLRHDDHDATNNDVNDEPRHEERDMPAGTISKSRDWRGLLATTTPALQGECGSCWAFATAVVLGAHSELYGEKRTFSPQHLVQCVANPRKCGGSGGCDGATVELGLEHVLQHGLATDEDLPYTGKEAECFDGPTPHVDGHKIKPLSEARQMNEAINTIASLLEKHHIVTDQSDSQKSQVATKTEVKAKVVRGLIGWMNPLHNNYQALLRALQDGPVAVALEATDSWYSYGGGIAGDDCTPGATNNHAVVLVGYGARGSLKYWLIQNSWGSNWGVNGFMRLKSRGQDEDNYCGWDTSPHVGSGCENGPAKVWVCGTCGILYDPVQPVFKK